jgi:hypothetical protein
MCLLVKICEFLIIIITILLLLVLLKILKDGTNGEHNCRNFSLELTIKARAYKGAGQKGSLRVTSHAPKNVAKCERMNSHTFK